MTSILTPIPPSIPHHILYPDTGSMTYPVVVLRWKLWALIWGMFALTLGSIIMGLFLIDAKINPPEVPLNVLHGSETAYVVSDTTTEKEC